MVCSSLVLCPPMGHRGRISKASQTTGRLTPLNGVYGEMCAPKEFVQNRDRRTQKKHKPSVCAQRTAIGVTVIFTCALGSVEFSL